MNLFEAYIDLQNQSGICEGDTVRVLRKASDKEMGWDNVWADPMDALVGNVYRVLSISSIGIRIDTVSCSYSLPFFVLEVVGKREDLPDPIEISSEYQCDFKSDGSITVGCQELSFKLIRKIYKTAKRVRKQS